MVQIQSGCVCEGLVCCVAAACHWASAIGLLSGISSVVFVACVLQPSFHACTDCAGCQVLYDWCGLACYASLLWHTLRCSSKPEPTAHALAGAISHARLSVLSAQCKELERVLEAHKPMVNKACHGEHMQVEQTCSFVGTTTCPVRNNPCATLPVKGAYAPALTGGMPSQPAARTSKLQYKVNVWATPCYQLVRMASLLTPFSDR